MNLVGKYLRLRRELLEPALRSPASALHLRRVEQDMVSVGTVLETHRTDEALFLETMPASYTVR